MSRSRLRTSEQFFLYSSNTSLGWRITKVISYSLGEVKVARGTARRVFDGFGKHIGYQLINVGPNDKKLPSRNSNPSITFAEVEANAGVRGESRTINLSQDLREERVVNGQSPEDFIERAVEKVKLWTRPAPGRGDRAVRVYPKATTCR